MFLSSLNVVEVLTASGDSQQKIKSKCFKMWVGVNNPNTCPSNIHSFFHSAVKCDLPHHNKSKRVNIQNRRNVGRWIGNSEILNMKIFQSFYLNSSSCIYSFRILYHTYTE